MESSLIRYFREVHRCGSIREASANLHVAPSALSRQIMQLEEQLGVLLFERRPRGMEATEAGEVVARFARDLETDIQRVRSEIDELNGLQKGRVRLLSTEGLVAHFLTETISSFSRTWPGVSIGLTVAGTELVAEGVANGSADIGFAFDMESNEQLDVVLQFSDPLCIVISPDHPLAQARKLALSDVASYPLAMPPKSFGIRRLLDTESRRSSTPLQPSMETNSIEALRVLARSGRYVTFLPSLPIRGELQSRKLVSVPILAKGLMDATHDVCIVANRRLPRAVSTFLEHTRRVATKWSPVS